MKKLKWEGLAGFNDMRWTPLEHPAIPGVTRAFCKTYKNFTFFWILKAGHMVRHGRGRRTPDTRCGVVLHHFILLSVVSNTFFVIYVILITFSIVINHILNV